MARKIITALLFTGVLGAFTVFAPLPHSVLQVSTRGTTVFEPTVQGVVTQKFTPGLIAVNGQPWLVPLEFYNRISVGMTVRFNGTQWSIVGSSADVKPLTARPWLGR